MLLHLKMPRTWGVWVMSCEGEGHLSQDSLLKGIKEPSHIKTGRCYWWSQDLVVELIAKVMVWMKIVFFGAGHPKNCVLCQMFYSCLLVGWLTTKSFEVNEWMCVPATPGNADTALKEKHENKQKHNYTDWLPLLVPMSVSVFDVTDWPGNKSLHLPSLLQWCNWSKLEVPTFSLPLISSNNMWDRLKLIAPLCRMVQLFPLTCTY